jgi:hypothetical protein
MCVDTPTMAQRRRRTGRSRTDEPDLELASLWSLLGAVGALVATIFGAIAALLGNGASVSHLVGAVTVNSTANGILLLAVVGGTLIGLTGATILIALIGSRRRSEGVRPPSHHQELHEQFVRNTELVRNSIRVVGTEDGSSD